LISGDSTGCAFDALLLDGEAGISEVEAEISRDNKGPKVHKNANFRKL
jgi:hypothetical protein